MTDESFRIRGWFEENKPVHVLKHSIGTHNMLDLTPHSGRKPFCTKFNFSVYFSHITQTMCIKKFSYPQISDLVKRDSVLRIAIKQTAEQIIREQRIARGTKILQQFFDPANSETDAQNNNEDAQYQEILKSQEKRAASILRNMRSTLNNFLISLTSWILYKLLPCFLSGVVTNTQQIKMLKNVSERSPGVPLIFLPLHRSHLDYIMVTFILANNDIRSPLVAAGNNLQIPIFGELLRGLGAFFIKRKIDPVVGNKDILYRAVLQLYLQHALKQGHNIEFFIEGGRTRTGKPCMPKGGILSVIVNAFMDRSISDALLVPVSVNYERLVDGNFVREQKGEKKVPETFRKAMAGIWKALRSNYGLMRIDFNEPYSIRELVQSYNKISKDEIIPKISKPTDRVLQHNQSTSSLYGTDVVCEEHRNLIESISRQVVYDCAQATSVMSTNALSFLMLNYHRGGADDREIASSLDYLRELLCGHKDIGFAGESLHIINYAADLLGEDLIARICNEDGTTILKPQPKIDSIIELSYYSNMLTPYFALQSILLTTFHKLLPPTTTSTKNCSSAKQNARNSLGISRTKLFEAALENCNVYRYEFILHKPTQMLKEALEKALDDLTTRNLIQLLEQSSIMDRESYKYSKNLNTCFDDDFEDDYAEIEKPDLFFTTHTIQQQKAICDVLAPFAHSYLAVAQSLCILYKNPVLETEFIKIVIKDLTSKVENGQCPYAESISTDSVRNCLKLLEKWSVIDIYNENGLRLLSLSRLYDINKESLNPIIQRIFAIVPSYDNGYF